MRMISFLIVAMLCGCIPDPSGSTTKKVVTDTSGFVVTDFDKPESPLSSPPDAPASDSIPPEEGVGVREERAKPVVLMYTAQHGVYCPGCIAAKKWHEAANKDELPFVLEYRTEYPEWISAIPTFHWNGKDSPKMLEGWYGGEHLIKSWKETQ